MDVWVQLRNMEEVLDACEGKVKHAGLSSIFHIFKAFEIKDVDPHMSVFRSICAEEEAATSLISSLQSANYPGAQKVFPNVHHNKMAVIFFIRSVMDMFGEVMKSEDFPLESPRVRRTDEPGRPALELYFPMKGYAQAMHPRPPLHLYKKGGDTFEEMVFNSLRKNISHEREAEIRGAIKSKANWRNTLLYASESSLPKSIINHHDFILNQAAIVLKLLVVVGLVDPWREPGYPKSNLVASVLNEYVRVMSNIKI